VAELISKTGERIIPEEFVSKDEFLQYLRHLYAYEFAKDNIPKTGLILDLGCGEGYGTSLLSRNVERIIGLDVDKDTIAHASREYGAENCIFKAFDGVKIPYGDDTIDAAVSFQVIEHIQDDENYVLEIYRVLKKNGIFILTTPNRTYRLKPGQKPWNRFHVREYYPEELESILKSVFSDVNVWGIRGTDEVQRLEIERVKRNLKAVSFDPLNLRKLIPEALIPAIIEIRERITGANRKRKNDNESLKKYSLKDFYVIKDNVRDSLDLLGVCRK